MKALSKDNNIINDNTLNLDSEMVLASEYDINNKTSIKLTDEMIEKINELIDENEKNRLLGRYKQHINN